MRKHSPQTWGRESLAGLPNNHLFLIGVSAGRDSVALLHWLLELGYRQLVVCHFEHGLRGRASKADAHFVRRLALHYGLKFELGTGQVRPLAKKRKQSLETVAREQRLKFFARVARRRRSSAIFLAHQADDQVETFLLNLFRGAGGRGLGAMRPRSTIGSLTVLRPFLGVWRAEIDAYVQKYNLEFREDASNAELAARRNRIRHKIIPWLEKQFGRSLRSTIWRAATILAEEEDFLATLTPTNLMTNEKIPVEELRKLTPSLQRRAILAWLRHKGVSEVSFEVIEQARGLLAFDEPARMNLARDRHLRRRGGQMFLE
ncbi:MAG TPA: tRNA lysidine(34) synthetase TilS [Chthoniobacterales bacterium]|jgi:tRNA(Ile)-lysidine synthase